MKKDRTCQYCNKSFIQIEGRIFSNHVKWCNKRDIQRQVNCQWCKQEICANNLDQHEDTCYENPENSYKKTNCLECSIPFIKEEANHRFCSHHCSAIYVNKERKENGWINPLKNRPQSTETKICVNCGKSFQCSICATSKIKCDGCVPHTKIKKYDSNGFRLYNGKIIKRKCVFCMHDFQVDELSLRKTCSKKCKKDFLTMKAQQNPNCGGETNYKKFQYKNQWFDSSWEIKLAEYLDQNKIEWVHSKKLCLFWFDKENKQRRYYPDFYLPTFNLYIDTKNKYLMTQDAYKIEQVRKNNNINLLVDSLENILIELNKRGISIIGLQ